MSTRDEWTIEEHRKAISQPWHSVSCVCAECLRRDELMEGYFWFRRRTGRLFEGERV